MSKKFKKHKFIPKEKIESLLKVKDLHLYLYRTQENAVNKRTNNLDLIHEYFVKTGYAQYAFAGADELYYDFAYLSLDQDITGDWNHHFTNINSQLKHILLDLSNSSDTRIWGLWASDQITIKPIFKLLKHGMPIDHEPESMHGIYQVRFEGLLIKRKDK